MGEMFEDDSEEPDELVDIEADLTIGAARFGCGCKGLRTCTQHQEALTEDAATVAKGQALSVEQYLSNLNARRLRDAEQDLLRPERRKGSVEHRLLRFVADAGDGGITAPYQKMKTDTVKEVATAASNLRDSDFVEIRGRRGDKRWFVTMAGLRHLAGLK